ncbi:hypothetical protein [Hyphomicrobium sp. CS1GBMeth3]|uniref:hypothetical protein n=1 Tax=Hyphomicrobium sp. CS1GBMeth3 TaxID=1892845 RepID=UPI0011149278|nr:hypothetical protein [Hyphomicrobium sp. CS1GBMeth3]
MLDLNQRIATDRHLQMELDKGMDSLAAGAEANTRQRLARVLSTVLEPAWLEHTSFQSDALFPLVVKYHGAATDMRNLLAQLSHEHEEISHCHRDVSVFLGNVIAGRRGVESGLSACLLRTVALRRNHYATETALTLMLPNALDEADCDTLDHWTRNRAGVGFPVNLILDIWD